MGGLVEPVKRRQEDIHISTWMEMDGIWDEFICFLMVRRLTMKRHSLLYLFGIAPSAKSQHLLIERSNRGVAASNQGVAVPMHAAAQPKMLLDKWKGNSALGSIKSPPERNKGYIYI